MNISNYFPVWDKLTKDQRNRIETLSEYKKVKKGTVLHNGSKNCLGLLLIRSGQLRSYMLSEEGREVTISRQFERDICLFSASAVGIS